MWIGIVLVTACVVVLAASSCSPGYVLRAGWEEAGILWRREAISDVIASGHADERTKRKLELVLQARDFAKELGLKPKESFTTFSQVDRSELLWVLSAAEKTRFKAKTWWFPIVGRVPYKGFFEKDDGQEEARALEAEGLDVHLRPSPAFSTLGWFNDPLLSTTLRADEVSVVNTVIHEILHNTIWIKDNVPFNESLANFVGSRGAIMFFEQKFGVAHEWTIESKARWARELRYADFLDELKNELTQLYDQAWRAAGTDAPNLPSTELERVLTERDRIFAEAVYRFFPPAEEPAAGTKRKVPPKMNNALVMAQQIYLTRPRLFERLFECHAGNLMRFIAVAKATEELVEKEDLDPYDAITRELQRCEPEKKGLAPGPAVDERSEDAGEDR